MIIVQVFEELVTQVGQEMVPVVVIGPPDNGAVVAMLVMPPPPIGACDPPLMEMESCPLELMHRTEKPAALMPQFPDGIGEMTLKLPDGINAPPTIKFP